jgi:hypothetical protein
MKVCRGRRYTAAILNLVTKWRELTALPLGKEPPVSNGAGGWVGPRASLKAVKKKNLLHLPGIELQYLDRTARTYTHWDIQTPILAQCWLHQN